MNKATGPLIGTVIIILVLLLGALYVFMQKRADDTNKPSNSEAVESSDESIDNEALTIEAELTAQEKEMDSLEAELDATNY